MQQITKKYFYLFTIAILLYTLYYQYISYNTKPFVTQKIPQEYMHNIAVTHFTEQGTIKDKIYANYWAYLSEKGHSELKNPYLKIIKPNNITWVITSDFAKAKHKTLDSKAEELELIGNVIAERPAINQTEHIKVATDSLFYYPKDESVKTDKFVKMNKPNLEITGTGIYGFLDKNWVKIYNNVTTRYEKND